MRPIILLITTLLCFTGFSQPYQDSLLQVIEQNESPSAVKEATFLLGEYLVQRNPEQAEKYADQLNSMDDTPADSLEWGRLNYVYAASHRWQGNYKTALEYYGRNYDYYKRAHDKKNIAKTGRFIGSINMFLGNNVLSQKHLIECAEIYNEIGTPRQKASINSSLASFYLNIDQYDKGLERYLDALSQFEAINDSAGMASVNANLGLVYSELGEYEKAEMHLLRQKGLNKVFPTGREMGFHHDFMGVLRREQGRLQEAYDEHRKGLEIRKGLSSTYNLCESRLNMGRVLIDLKKFDQAIFHLNDVLNYEEHESHNQQSRAHQMLSEANEKKNDYLNALKHFKRFKAVEDTIYNQESIQVIAEKDARYKKQEQDAEIALLNKENEIAAAQLSRNRLILYGSLVGLALFSLLSFFIFRMYKRIKDQNVVIKKALHEKGLLIHEIHHRVKNNLQIISSLLNLQSRYITDENALEAISDGRNRVQSMAILHKNLYQEDDLTGVDMKSYFSNLIQGIFDSYNLAKDQVKLNMDIEDVKLDIDTVIPIGLITNELITNSLKYAFEKDFDQATIEVKLKEGQEDYELIISDNGVGIQQEVIKRTKEKTFGQRMIRAFVQKLSANMKINNEAGTKVIIQIPKLEVA